LVDLLIGSRGPLDVHRDKLSSVIFEISNPRTVLSLDAGLRKTMAARARELAAFRRQRSMARPTGARPNASLAYSYNGAFLLEPAAPSIVDSMSGRRAPLSADTTAASSASSL